MLKQGLNIGLRQSLTMTPQLQQSIKLLQLSALELQQEIQEVLDENPLLEIEEDPFEKVETENTEPFSEEQNIDTAAQTLEDVIPSDLEIDANWDDVYEPNSSINPPNNVATSDYLAENPLQSTVTHNLQTHLLEQVRLSHLSALDKFIAELIINQIDDNGYLKESIENIYHFIWKNFSEEIKQFVQEHFDKKTQLENEDIFKVSEVKAVLTYIQHLDPIGIGAKNLGECLSIQLQYHFDVSPLILKTARLLEENLDLVAQRNYKKIKEYLKVSQKDLEIMLSYLKGLNPKPGSIFENSNTDYVIPDVFVEKKNGNWYVRLNGANMPNLQINDVYSNLINKVHQKNDSIYLKKNLQQARWFMQSIQNRSRTILNVAQAIINKQTAFLEYGDEAMRPMLLKDIAEMLEMHESSISRVTTNKYMYTPRGVYEFKYFFSSQIATDSGEQRSSTAIRAMLKKLIKEENRKKPLSDDKLRLLLKKSGIKVARRTIAKYRESMRIPSSRERKKLI